MIKNYIFDFGNVLARFYADELTGFHVTDTEEIRQIGEVVFDRLYWDRLDNGKITDEEVIAGICSRLPANLRKKACDVYNNWVRNLTPVKGMQQLVTDLAKTDAKIYLLSNISIKFANEFSSVDWINDLFSHFDGIVLSGPIGKIKPNTDIFEHLLDQFNLKAEECVFIDDTQVNVDGAAKAGIQGYLFDGEADKLREFLKL